MSGISEFHKTCIDILLGQAKEKVGFGDLHPIFKVTVLYVQYLLYYEKDIVKAFFLALLFQYLDLILQNYVT